MEAKKEREHEKLYGGFNDFPPNWKEITEKEFAQGMFFSYTPTLTEHRQMGRMEVGSEPMLTATLYFFHDGSGVALASDFWAGKVRYFSFTCCVHEFRRPTEAEHVRGVVRPGRCFHVSICDKCNYVSAVDSSD
jgi:hypothetical protein